MTAFKNIMTLLMTAYSIVPSSATASAATAQDRHTDSGERQNLAYMRPVRTSSVFDYNLTGQLITDGITASTMPPSLTVSTAQGLLPRREREWAIDGGQWTHNTLAGPDNFIQYEWTGMDIRADRIEVRGTVAYHEEAAHGGYSVRLLMPASGKGGTEWRVIGEERGDGLPGTPSKYKMSSDPNKQTRRDLLPARSLSMSFLLPEDCRDISRLRVEVKMEGAAYWNVGGVNFYNGTRQTVADLLPNSRFGSAWMSDGEGQQWAQVDLGGRADIESVKLAWIRRPRKGCVEVSDDAVNWMRVATLAKDKNRREESISIRHASGRYVRISMDGGSIDVAKAGSTPTAAYILSEMEVHGTGPRRDCTTYDGSFADGRLSLNGCGTWAVCRASEVEDGGEAVSSGDYRQGRGWIPAVVPGTVLTSFVRYGAIDDPNIADNIFSVSDSYFNSDFWYRRQFVLPEAMKGKRVALNFDGINWKADVWINGHRADRIEGAFRRGVADITPYLKDGDNTIAVHIIKNAHPGAVKEKNHFNTDYNGGILGADNPTFHATTGWDWISTIRGRDIGIWNDVYLTATSNVVLSDPLVSTRLAALPDTTATMTPRVVVHNTLDDGVSGILRGWIGDICFERNISLKGGETREVVFEPEDFPVLRNRRMRLWWPNGYGEPCLYEAGFEFAPSGGSADGAAASLPTASISYKAGIRQVTYADPKTQLKIYVNGRRFIPLGGNWGFSEANLNYRQREYDTAVRLHRAMNFNMIRNWVGMTGDEEFYDACDKYGIMVWQDFWLANPADGPDPENEPMFMDNATDFTQRMRQHPSIALYCGRNEGYPPKTLDDGLRATVGRLNPGMLYISSSADEGVSGHGPYWAEPPRTYFASQTGKLHTERGMPNIPSPEGIAKTLAQPTEWQPGDAWGQHDFTQAGAQRGASFTAIIERMFGKPESAEQFARLAQWENYEGYRAMYEADSRYRQGLLIWMSHPCWPSFTWQCYDYFFEPTAAFFGARKACESIHIQRNALTRNVEVVNRSAGTLPGLTATRELLDIHGNTVSTASATTDSPDDSTTELPALATDSVPDGIDGSVYFLRLTLADTDGKGISSNFYVLSTDEGNLQQLNSLPEVNLAMSATRPADNAIDIRLRNESATPAMMIRANLKTDDGKQVLPVDYSDNYFHLMPGEERTVRIEWDGGDTRHQTPFVELTGFNVKQRTIR